MADYYVDSNATGGSNTGADWANAYLSIDSAISVATTAGDRIFVASDHLETFSTTKTLQFSNNGIKIISVNKSTGEATSGAQIQNSGNYAFNVRGSAYFFGIKFEQCSDGGSHYQNLNIGNLNEVMCFEQCWLINSSINANAGLGIPAGQNCVIRLVDCHYEVNGTGSLSRLFPMSFGSTLCVEGGEVDLGLVAPRVVSAGAGQYAANFSVSGMDLTNLSASAPLFTQSSTGAVRGVFRNCKLPAGWSGSLTEAGVADGTRIELHNCDSGDVNYNVIIEDYRGYLYDETIIVRSNGANDGVTPISWRIVTKAAAKDEFPFASHEIAVWNETVGSPVTVTVHVVHDSQGGGTSNDLTDKEAWLEVMGLDTSGFPLGGWYSDRAADFLDAAADQTDDSATTWTTTGLTTPVKQKFSVTFTPQEKGFIVARVCVAKPSTTVYVCPKIELS